MRVLHDFVIIRPIFRETAGAIELPVERLELRLPTKGEVVAVGRGPVDDEGRRVSLDVEEGDVVLFEKYSQKDVVVAGEDLLLIRERSILGRLSL